MDNEKLQRGNELVEAIKEVKEFLFVRSPSTGNKVDLCRFQIRIQYNVPFSAAVKSATINADRIPDAFIQLFTNIEEQLAEYEKEFAEL